MGTLGGKGLMYKTLAMEKHSSHHSEVLTKTA